MNKIKILIIFFFMFSIYLFGCVSVENNVNQQSHQTNKTDEKFIATWLTCYELKDMLKEGEEDVFIGVLEDMLAEKKDSPIHLMLLDYIKETNDEDELIDALFEFNLAIDLFKTVRKEVAFQIKADDFNLALNKAEEICELKSILESRYKIRVIETKAMPFVDYESVVTRKKNMYILLPMVRCEDEKDELLERILSFCMHRFCSEQFDFQTVSSITEHFMPRENQFEMQLRQLFKEKTHNIMNGIEENTGTSDVFGKDIFDAIKKNIQ